MDQTIVEGKLLSDVDANYPGSIVWWENKYKFGNKQGGVTPKDQVYELHDIPVLKVRFYVCMYVCIYMYMRM